MTRSAIPIHHLKTLECPHCQCNLVVAETVETGVDPLKIRRHCNGEQWETRKFACGYTVRYVPNFQREEVKWECDHSEEAVAKVQRANEARDSIADHCAALGLADSAIRCIEMYVHENAFQK